jgi:hypothetical protein
VRYLIDLGTGRTGVDSFELKSDVADLSQTAVFILKFPPLFVEM